MPARPFSSGSFASMTLEICTTNRNTLFSTCAASLSAIRTLVLLTGSGPMEEAAIHRMATSITQLTLCQVSMEEIQASDPPMPVDYDELQEH